MCKIPVFVQKFNLVETRLIRGHLRSIEANEVVGVKMSFWTKIILLAQCAIRLDLF